MRMNWTGHLFSGVLLAVLALPSDPVVAYTIYVSNEKDNTISIIDSDNLEVFETIAVGQRPRGITLTKDGKFLLVCASDDDTVEMIDVCAAQTGDIEADEQFIENHAM